MASCLISWFVFVIFTSATTASHFRGGIITWKPDENITNKVNFNFRLGFRRSFSNSYFCDSAMVAQQAIVGSGGTWSARHEWGYYGSVTVANTGYHCTDFSVNEDWTQGENTFNYTFPDDGPWLVSYSSCCWISLANGGHGGWFLSTTVNLTRRQDTGKINSSPISALSPIVRHQQGCSKIIVIPAEDLDGDKVRCRWSNGSQRECGGVCQRFIYSGTLDEDKCTLRIHSNAALGWHAVAITLEDFPASTTNFQSATPFSHVSLQFLVHVASSSGPCNRVPELIGRSPNDGSCEEVPNGDTFHSIIEAKHIDSSRRIAEIITVTPLYMNLSNLLNYTDNVGDIVYYKTVSWTPKSSQKGRHIFCFKAIDDYGMESDQRCITILVGSNTTPRPILSTRTPLIPTLSWPWGTGFVDFNITFDQQIKRPRHSKFIRIILEGHVIYKLNTRSSSDVTIDQNGFTLRFRLSQVVMSMRGNYSVTLDRGAVVGLGCTSDGPPTPGISSFKSWTFSVGVCSKGTFIADSYNCNDVDECSNPPSILSRKKRNIWYWPYSYNASLLPVTASPSKPRSTEITPTPSLMQGSSASVTSAVLISGSCPYNISGQLNGRLTSPNYPRNYGSYERCSLLIEAPYGHYIYLQFRSFYLEYGGAHCPYDYVEVFDGSSAWSYKMTKACGQRAPCGIKSSGRFLFVKFYSDGSQQRPGFSAYYNAVSYSYNAQQVVSSAAVKWCISSSSMSSSRAPSSPSSPRLTEITPTPSLTQGLFASVTSTVLVSGSCPYNISGQLNGRFTSPNYPWNYGRNERCSLLIEAPYGHYIYLQFRSFYLEYGRSHCPYDYVEVFDGSSAWSYKITRACGQRRQAPCEIYSSGRFLFVKFSSDSSGQYPGFSAYYYAVSNSQNVQQVSPIAKSSCNFVTSSPLISSTRAMHSSPPVLVLSPTPDGYTWQLPLTLSLHNTAAMYTSPNLLTSTPTGSVVIQAFTSMVMPTASRVPFVLHLPANCQHNCVNTWGSYYCTCNQGYKLQADGTTCEDVNECETQNGGCTHQCINIPGSHYCKCREGTTMSIDNKTCHEPGINVKCADETMSIILERKSFQGFDPNKLTLLYPSCRASYNDTHITLRTSLNDCGTTHNESEDAITFYNEVRSLQFSPGNIITRDQNVSIPFYCSFGRKALVRNPSFKTWKNYVTSSEGGYGNFTFTMDMFKTSNYYTPYVYDDYPITVNLQDRLFLQVAVKSHQSNLVVFVDTCKATPSSDPYSVPQYIFIQRGCALDSTLNYSYSINSKQRFSIQAFRFIQDHLVVHFHCEVLACHRNTARSRCLQGCSRSRGRRDEDPGSESTQVYEMSSGPIKFQKKSPGNVDKNVQVKTNVGLVTAVAATGGVFLILAIALAVAVVQVKKRFKGALADRNRVYAMEQFNKYVKNEKDNDGFVQDDDVNGSGEQNFNMKACT